jgi:hypothetical protein
MPGVVVTSMPAIQMPSATWPDAKNLPGPSTDSTSHGGQNYGDWRNRLQASLAKLSIPLDAFDLNGGADMPATVTVPWFGGTVQSFTFHWMISSTFPNASALDALRIIFRTLCAAMLYFSMCGRILHRFEIVQ